MAETLKDMYVFGPVKSRRLGISLGINILPTELKVCNFNCIYCECGWNSNTVGDISDSDITIKVLNSNPTSKKFPNKNEIKNQLENKLFEIVKSNNTPITIIDTITFAGNGEPTLHPDFLEIINDTIEIRNKFCPTVKISVLSNATRLLNKNVFDGLSKIENPILKLDSAKSKTLEKINLPNIFSDNFIEKIVEGMQQFNGNFILQIMFLRGEHNGIFIDNTTVEEISGLIEIMELTKPRQVMIYPIDRATPAKNLIKLDAEEMQKIATQIEAKGFNVTVAR